MMVPPCAPRWLRPVAKRMIRESLMRPGVKTHEWVETWDASLHWIHLYAYSILYYRSGCRVDSSRQMQMAEVFASASHRNLVAIYGETDCSGYCFFGAPPASIRRAVMDFDAASAEETAPIVSLA